MAAYGVQSRLLAGGAVLRDLLARQAAMFAAMPGSTKMDGRLESYSSIACAGRFGQRNARSRSAASGSSDGVLLRHPPGLLWATSRNAGTEKCLQIGAFILVNRGDQSSNLCRPERVNSSVALCWKGDKGARPGC
jgi:hypothetical protein